MTYIQFKNVTREYRNGEKVTRANDRVSFDIDKGSFTVILGPSGAGKSTTLNMLGGMDHPSSGQVIVGDEDISTYTDKQLTTFRRENIGFVFQNYNLVPNLTALENVELSIQISKSQANAHQVLEQCGLAHRADNFPAQLSGGEQQRVSIARAIASQPKLLLADEPTGALDFETGQQILGLLQDICHDLGTTVVVITHNSTIAQMAHRVIHIHDGRVAKIDNHATPMKVQDILW